MINEKLSNKTPNPPLRKGVVISRILFGFVMCVIGLNVGIWVGIGLFKLIMWLGILPYLEKFFGWFVF